MSELNDGGPAFPPHASSTADEYMGMSLRDYFAAKALVGAISNSADCRKSYAEYAERSYKMADAMLREREHQK